MDSRHPNASIGWLKQAFPLPISNSQFELSVCCRTVILAGMPKSSVQGWQALAYFVP